MTEAQQQEQWKKQDEFERYQLHLKHKKYVSDGLISIVKNTDRRDTYTHYVIINGINICLLFNKRLSRTQSLENKYKVEIVFRVLDALKEEEN